MTVTSKALVPAKQVETAQTTQYTATNCTAYIDKCTVTNNTAANIQFSANIVANGGTPGAGNLLLATRSIAPRETYLCPELVGHVLEPAVFLSTLAGAAGLTIRVSGREIT